MKIELDKRDVARVQEVADAWSLDFEQALDLCINMGVMSARAQRPTLAKSSTRARRSRTRGPGAPEPVKDIIPRL